MTKWAFLFCFLTLWAETPAAAQEPAGGDTLDLPFRLIGRKAGDTSYLYMNPPSATWPESKSYFERYFNKNLRGVYHRDTMVSGIAIVWFVIDKQGICTSSYCDTTVSEPEIAHEVLWVTNKMNSMYRIAPSRIGGKPVISRVKMRVVCQFAVNYIHPPAPAGPRPDILVIGYPPQY